MDLGYDLESLIDDVDIHENENVERVQRRYVRDGINPFECYNEHEFKRRYRFDKNSVRFGILPEIADGLTEKNNPGLPIPPEMQLLICLRYYATGSFEVMLADTISVSQPTIPRVVFRVSILLASLLRKYIKMPDDQETRNENRRLFRDLSRGNGAIGLPGIDGAIDCTHIRLVETKFQNFNEVYRNRRGYFSLNVQAVVGPKTEFLDIVPEYVGSTQDSRIFQNSSLYKKYREGRLDGMLVGDREYPCLTFLMTPVRNPETEEEIRYNQIHARARIVVERTFGIWKRRFPCLSTGLTTKLLGSTTTVVACAVLHNMSLIFNDALPEEEEANEEAVNVDGFATRETLIARLFR